MPRLTNSHLQPHLLMVWLIELRDSRESDPPFVLVMDDQDVDFCSEEYKQEKSNPSV